MFQKTRIARGHILFAQANSLCVALIHNSTVLTQESNLKFIEKVKLHDNVRAEATVINRTNRHYDIKVESFVKDTRVFTGIFKMFYISEDENCCRYDGWRQCTRNRIRSCRKSNQ